jgi:hypothetical protein
MLGLFGSLGLAGAAGKDTSVAPSRALFRDGTLTTRARSVSYQLPLVSGTSGGTYATANGATVQVYSADQYLAADPSFNQRWADFLASAPHGDELSQLTLVLLPLSRVQSYCGAQALACYANDTIVAPGDDPAPDLPATSIILHEYGHHIAYHRSNDPWAAIDYGTKRWASDENICRAAANGSIYPGNEDANYQLNPGEAWAETYRVLAERALGLTSPAWSIVSSSFYPDDAALAAASADVLDPWTADNTTTVRGSFRRAQMQRRLAISTPYDGMLRIALANRTKSALKLRLQDGSGNALATSAVAASRTKTLRSSICGQRSLQLTLSRTTTGAGSFSATISKP